MHLLDSNVFIQAKNTYYSFEVCPGFWTWVRNAHESGDVASIESVLSELKDGNDHLKEWASENSDMFLPLSSEENIAAALQEVSSWVYDQGYEPSAISTYLSQADYFICAHALAGGHTVVTHEMPSPDAKKRVLIPNVCLGLSIPYKNIHSLLQSEKARFVLDS